MEATDKQYVYSCFERIIIFLSLEAFKANAYFFNYKSQILQRSETIEILKVVFLFTPHFICRDCKWVEMGRPAKVIKVSPTFDH